MGFFFYLRGICKIDFHFHAFVVLLLSFVNVHIVCCDTIGQEQTVWFGGSVNHSSVQTHSGDSISAHSCVSRGEWVSGWVSDWLSEWVNGRLRKNSFCLVVFPSFLFVLVVLTRRRWCVCSGFSRWILFLGATLCDLRHETFKAAVVTQLQAEKDTSCISVAKWKQSFLSFINCNSRRNSSAQSFWDLQLLLKIVCCTGWL